MKPPSYETSVFINCPFDRLYQPLFRALFFAVHDCGYAVRSALEVEDSGEARYGKLLRLIGECRYGIHDISRVQLDSAHRLPRFNMPLELGLFLGAARFGDRRQRTKRCLVLETERYRFQRFCSDLAGQDIQAHHGKPRLAIEVVRNWLSAPSAAQGTMIPSGSRIAARYASFLRDLPDWCHALHLNPRELTFSDFGFLTTQWLEENRL